MVSLTRPLPERLLPCYADPSFRPEVRDNLIVNGISYAPEGLASQFASDISFIWAFELRDVCKYQISKGTYTFSEEFNNAYHDLKSWTLNSTLSPILFPAPQPNPDLAIDTKFQESQSQPWLSTFEGAFHHDEASDDTQLMDGSDHSVDSTLYTHPSTHHSSIVFGQGATTNSFAVCSTELAPPELD